MGGSPGDKAPRSLANFFRNKIMGGYFFNAMSHELCVFLGGWGVGGACTVLMP